MTDNDADEIASIERDLLDLLNRLNRVRSRNIRCEVPVMEPSRREDRRYVAGPQRPEWQHVSVLAVLLQVHENTAFRIAGEASAQWPHGSARKVDMSKFRDTLPNLQKIAKNAT